MDLKRRIEKIFGLERWTNWWMKDKEMPGLGSKIVIVGCHLDSTASLIRNEAGDLVKNDAYKPNLNDAPGADDDGSGLSATLELTRLFSQFKGKLKHTIQFCFFNAEEVGMRGSMKYSRYMKEINAPIKAVVCMDMIGYNKDNSNRTYEIHAGFYNETIRNRCLPLAEKIVEHSERLGKLGTVQVYKGMDWDPVEQNPDTEDRDMYDSAILRSDHWSFQNHGFPAVLISEDFFANDPLRGDPAESDDNPNYHQVKDKFIEIDPIFASDIASAVLSAVKELAEK